MAEKKKNAISPTRAENFPEWYQAVVRAADLAELAHVRGCMVIKPWGFGIWELIQRGLDAKFKETGHENAYFPLFIPASYLEREAEHVEGFAKEMAVVTHHRLEEHDGKLEPAAELPEPLIVRPTSETIIGKSLSSWIHSYRDLPVLLNQWANVVRWELRPRVFLRTTEFLWQEGHTAHATKEEAVEETERMLEVYRSFVEEQLAIPVVQGDKPPHERFPGAVQTLAIEAMMQDGKALQSGTSHYLGQNFARAMDISFTDRDGTEQLVWTTSWGMSTRTIGGVIMVHGDDDGLRIPPRVAPYQVVVVPIHRGDDTVAEVNEFVDALVAELRGQLFAGEPVRAYVDSHDRSPADKRWEWIQKGAPVVLEVGPRDVAGGQVTVTRRDRGPGERSPSARAEFVGGIAALLGEIQASYWERASEYLRARTRDDIATLDELREFFSSDAAGIGQAGFVRAPWNGDAGALEHVADLAVTIRCVPLDAREDEGRCVLTGEPARTEAVFARAY